MNENEHLKQAIAFNGQLIEAVAKIAQLREILRKIYHLTLDSSESITPIIYSTGKANYLAETSIDELIIWIHENPWVEEAMTASINQVASPLSQVAAKEEEKL